MQPLPPPLWTTVRPLAPACALLLQLVRQSSSEALGNLLDTHVLRNALAGRDVQAEAGGVDMETETKLVEDLKRVMNCCCGTCNILEPGLAGHCRRGAVVSCVGEVSALLGQVGEQH